jgi:DNA-binding response OmpR family regulator
MLRILLVEDEKKMAELLKRSLEEQYFVVQTAYSGRDGIELARKFPFDVIVLDVMLPDVTGFDAAQALRRDSVTTPILFLTARDAELDIVLGLEIGGDDYLTKPFAFAELLARIRALSRRRHELPPQQLQVGDLVLDITSHEVSRGGVRIELSPTEYQLLEFLMRNRNQAIKRQTLVDAVWGFGRAVENNTLDAFIRLLRKKIDIGYSAPLLQTVRGFGYRLGQS